MSTFLTDLTERITKAIQAGGGISKVSVASGLPTKTLERYLKGDKPRADTIRRIAEGAGVRLEWIIAGEEPMRAPTPAPQNAAIPADLRLFATVNVERLGTAILEALALFQTRGQTPDPRRLGQVTALIYDERTAAAPKKGAAQSE